MPAIRNVDITKVYTEKIKVTCFLCPVINILVCSLQDFETNVYTNLYCYYIYKYLYFQNFTHIKHFPIYNLFKKSPIDEHLSYFHLGDIITAMLNMI